MPASIHAMYGGEHNSHILVHMISHEIKTLYDRNENEIEGDISYETRHPNMLFEFNHWQNSAEEQRTEDDDEVGV